MNTKRTKKAGFTLIELLVVIAIIGVLSGIVLQSLNSARVGARNASRLTAIDQMNKALELSATGGTNALPSTGNSWICLGLASDSIPNTCGGTVDATHIANVTIQNNLAGKIIPRDPKFLDGIGTAYLYNSKVTPPAGITTGTGAYLSWVMENTTSCGRGQKATDPVTNGNQCFLRISNQI